MLGVRIHVYVFMKVHVHMYVRVFKNTLCIYVVRVTSVNRVLSQGGDGASSELCVIQLILHLNLNAARLQQILQGTH